MIRYPLILISLRGLIVLFYVLYHLAHYTFHITNPEFAVLAKDFKAYEMVVQGFSVWWVSLFYIVGTSLLFLHLSHGVSSLFQTLGLNHHKYNDLYRMVGPGLSIVLWLGFVSIPVSVLVGLVK